jgi:DNA-binding transcriptional LysR family regulator
MLEGCTDQPVMEFDRVETIKEVVACGMGYGVVPRTSLQDVGERPDLQTAGLQPPVHQTWVVVTRKDGPANPALEVVCDAIVLTGSSTG